MTEIKGISLKKAAYVTGISLLIMVILAPYAELYVLPKLVKPFNSLETAHNIIDHQFLFVSAIFSYLITFILDLIISWSLFILLKPVNKDLALITSGFRVIYTILAIVSLNNLITAFQLLTTPKYSELFEAEQVQNMAMVALRAFKNHWYFALIFFGIHLLLLGYLVFRSRYIPRILGIVLMITGIGYFMTSIQPYLFPGINIDFAQFTFYGEIIFMLWLLIRGYKIEEPTSSMHFNA